MKKTLAVLTLLAGQLGFASQTIDLPQLHVNPSTITVSGLSSGAFLAADLLVAASDVFAGAAAVAGGIPNCAEGSSQTAQDACMKSPDSLDVGHYVDLFNKMAASNEIPPLSNLKTKRLYIYNGSQDSAVNPESGHKLQDFAENFMPAANIKTEFSIASGHGMPTLNQGNSCSLTALPWIVSCNYDAAGELLQFLSARTLTRGKANPSHLYQFSQTPYLAQNSMMDATGSIYIPDICQNQSCDLHVALHGCMQNPMFVQQQYVSEAGYNEWAEQNGIVVLYPTVDSGGSNPYGCWDWWGYSGSDYLTKNAPQIQSLLKMVEHLSQ